MTGTRTNTVENRRRAAQAARRREARWAAVVERCRAAGARMVACDADEMGQGNACDGSAWDRVRAGNSRESARRCAEGHEAAVAWMEAR